MSRIPAVAIATTSVLLSCMACAASPTSRVAASPAPKPVAVRWATDLLDQEEGLLSCPAAAEKACQHLATYDAANDEYVGGTARSPDQQRIAVKRISAEGGCRVELFDVDGPIPLDQGCDDVGKRELLWIDDDHLWVTSSGGTSVASATLVSATGHVLWSSVDLAIELAPSGRYVAVGSNSHGGAWINRVSLIDLRVPGGASLATLPVPDQWSSLPEPDRLAVRWERDRVVLTWAGTAPTGIAVAAPGARSTPERADLVDTRRPFAAN